MFELELRYGRCTVHKFPYLSFTLVFLEHVLTHFSLLISTDSASAANKLISMEHIMLIHHL